VRRWNNTTYLNDDAQTPLGRFVVYMLYSQLCDKYSDKSNRRSLGLSLSVVSSTVGAISSSPSSTTLLIRVNECRGEFFVSPQLCIQQEALLLQRDCATHLSVGPPIEKLAIDE